MPRQGLSQGILVLLEETPAQTSANAAWAAAEVRVPVGNHNGSDNALVHARLAPGEALSAYRCANCEQVYYVAAGSGTAGAGDFSAPVREGSFVFVPKGVAHWLRNDGGAGALEIFNVLTGAGSLDAAGISSDK